MMTTRLDEGRERTRSGDGPDDDDNDDQMMTTRLDEGREKAGDGDGPGDGPGAGSRSRLTATTIKEGNDGEKKDNRRKEEEIEQNWKNI